MSLNLFNILLDKLGSLIGWFPLTEPGSDKIVNSQSGISLRKFQYDIQDLPGMMKKGESEALFYLSTFTQKRGDIIEIGSWLGKSTIHLAKGCKLTGNGVVHAIDTFKGNPQKEHLYTKPLKARETIYQRFIKNIKAARLENFIIPYKMTSKEARKKINVSARLIFIDGCHDYEAVKEDILLWKSLLIKGGLIALHDFRNASQGSKRAIQEEVINSKDFKPLLLVDSLLIAQKL